MFVEAPTNFYLGRAVDPDTKKLTDEVVYYDSRDLVTHAVVLGMTGSGKTGLCISMLEEAIIDRVPAIIIDPKGDITNLLLNFPDLQPQDFEPWVNVDDARMAGMNVPEFSVREANRWREGLAQWGIVPERLMLLQRIAQYRIYTPGSDAGIPVNILSSFAAPRSGWAGHEEFLREQIKATVNALFALVGRNADMTSKEHVLLSNIFEYAWQQGQDLTLETLIMQVQQPPFERLGVLPIDDYIKERDRYKLAMELNGLVASPSFKAWTSGYPLDIQQMLYQPNGRPRVSIFYTAHLNDSERLFFMTLLLENVISWMRKQTGTTSLRAILYIDELFGYFPPHPFNPPTKEPLMMLLKQARAFGLGVVLATQNPVDLDYKGLSNAGTWFIGRLNSENDKQRVIAGLDALATADNELDMADVSRLISDLPPRVFLMRNLHSREPVLVHSRWAMSYLRGPLNRVQIQSLMAQERAEMTMLMGMAYPPRPASLPDTGPIPAANVPQVPQVPGAHTPPIAPPPVPGSTVSMRPVNSVPQPPTPPTNPYAAQQATPPPPPMQSTQPLSQTQSTAPIQGTPYTQTPPPLPSAIAQYYLPTTVTAQQAFTTWTQSQRATAGPTGSVGLVYRPVLMAQADIRYQDTKSKIFTSRSYAFHVPDVDRAGFVQWEAHSAPVVDPAALGTQPFSQAAFEQVPASLTDASRQTSLRRELTDYLYSTAVITIPFNPSLGIYGNPDADPSQFFAMLQQAARERRDAELDKVTDKFRGQMEKLEDRYMREQQELRMDQKALRQLRREELYTKGEAITSILRGYTNYTLTRMSRAKRYRDQQVEDVAESQMALRDLEQKMGELEKDFEDTLHGINDKWARVAAEVQDYVIRPYKKDVNLRVFGVGWVPHWYMPTAQGTVMLPAFG